jgi:hypothetical protein
MNGPHIEWFVIEPDNTLAPYEEYYAGEYRPGETLELSVQVWNNRWGQSALEDAINCKAVLFFDNYEDSMLLNNCSMKIGSGDYMQPELLLSNGYFELGTLSGKTNDGTMKSVENYKTLTFKFGPVTNSMRNSLKSMFIDLEFDSK